MTEFLLFAADRAQDVHEVILPALRAGRVVLADRFVDSSLAYQAHGLGMDLDSVLSANRIATDGLRPDLTLLLDIDVAEGVARAKGRSHGDRIEERMLEFHQRVRDAYHQMAAAEPDRFRVIDVTGKPAESVHEEVLAQVLTSWPRGGWSGVWAGQEERKGAGLPYPHGDPWGSRRAKKLT